MSRSLLRSSIAGCFGKSTASRPYGLSIARTAPTCQRERAAIPLQQLSYEGRRIFLITWLPGDAGFSRESRHSRRRRSSDATKGGPCHFARPERLPTMATSDANQADGQEDALALLPTPTECDIVELHSVREREHRAYDLGGGQPRRASCLRLRQGPLLRGAGAEEHDPDGTANPRSQVSSLASPQISPR